MSRRPNTSAFAPLAAVVLLGACSSSQPAKPTADAAVSFSLPDAGPTCLGSSTPTANPTDAGDPLCTSKLPKVSYTNDVAPILAQCTGEVCHAPWNVENSVGQPSVACCDHRLLIVPGQPSASHIIQAVRGTGACVPQMPLDQGVLPAASVATLVAWVCQGATSD
jgi:hypothetical protein